uniref:Elongation of very long chain fatty acids protein n=1 Tax=Locusta migratoria TaxID=7004 RepID=A0A6N0A1Y4_LOCMI|nr:fatty acid elongase 4 [Locusta migratoria]
MTQLVQDLVHGYRDIMDNRSDPRVNHWPMMSSPMPTLIICILYAYCSKVVGPKLMENRKPFQLRNVLIVYNLLQTLFSSWIFYEYLQSGWAGHYSFRCQPVDYSYSPMGLRMANTCWWYYISKFTEFFDTLFFILRKKNKQVSNLHVIHHGCMPMSVWMGLKFAPGGHSWIGIKWVPSGSTFLPAMANSFIHVLMYTYYGLSALGPAVAKYLWWKKYLTILQLIQFTTAMVMGINGIRSGCDFPIWMQYTLVIYMMSFIALFGNFYAKAYMAKGSKVFDGNESSYRKCISQEVHQNGFTSHTSNGITEDKSKKIK